MQYCILTLHSGNQNIIQCRLVRTVYSTSIHVHRHQLSIIIQATGYSSFSISDPEYMYMMRSDSSDEI